jgi:hypothetical protein
MKLTKIFKNSLLLSPLAILLAACGDRILGLVFIAWLVSNHKDVRMVDPHTDVNCHAAEAYDGTLKTECRSWDDNSTPFSAVTEAEPSDVDLATALAARSGMTYAKADQALAAFRDADLGNYSKITALGFTATDLNLIKTNKGLPRDRIDSLARSFNILPQAMSQIISDLAKSI